MSEQPSAQEEPESRRTSTRRSRRVTELLNEPCSRKTPLGTDTAWALKLKDAVAAAVCELHVQVLSARPVCAYAAGDANDMLFELETDRGKLQAIRTRAGKHVFNWL